MATANRHGAAKDALFAVLDLEDPDPTIGSTMTTITTSDPTLQPDANAAISEIGQIGCVLA